MNSPDIAYFVVKCPQCNNVLCEVDRHGNPREGTNWEFDYSGEMMMYNVGMFDIDFDHHVDGVDHDFNLGDAFDVGDIAGDIDVGDIDIDF